MSADGDGALSACELASVVRALFAALSGLEDCAEMCADAVLGGPSRSARELFGGDVQVFEDASCAATHSD